MPHDDFISNDLVNMRERLRRNYEERCRSAAVETVPVPEKAAEAPEQAKRLPSLQNADLDEETRREFRDLEGRLLRDSEASQTLAAMLTERVEQNERFHTLCASLLEELQGASGEVCTPEQLRSWRMKYMSALGRWSTACSAESGQCFETRQNAEAVQSGKYWRLLAAALIVSALIIAGTLFALWG